MDSRLTASRRHKNVLFSRSKVTRSDDKASPRLHRYRHSSSRGACSSDISFSDVAAKATDRTLPEPPRPLRNTAGTDGAVSDAEDDETCDPPEPVQILQSATVFKEVTVWGHDMLPAVDDPFVKGIEEWVAFAEAIHGQPSKPEPTNSVSDKNSDSASAS